MGGGSTHARIYALIFTALDDTRLEKLIWMPAHQTMAAVGVRAKGNNEFLIALDLETNDLADRLAKRGVEDHRVPFLIRDKWKLGMEVTKARAMWIGRAASMANTLPNFPYSDSSASRVAADRARMERLRNNQGNKKPSTRTFARPVELGGHVVEPVGGKGGEWRCATCRVRSKQLGKLAPGICKGSAAEKWAVKGGPGGRQR